MSDWCILRTSGRHTLPLAESLGTAGLAVWTPSAQVRKPRSRADRLAPLLPTYVFAKARHLLDLLNLAASPSKDYPDFSVFHYDRKIPLIADDDLRGLRLSERKVTPRAKQRTFSRGESVTAHDGAWAGLPGIVEKDQGRFVLVTFDRYEVRIARFLLDPSEKMAA